MARATALLCFREEVDIRGAGFSPDGAILSGIADISEDVGPAFGIFGLAIPPQSKPTIRLTQVEAATGRKLLDREITT